MKIAGNYATQRARNCSRSASFKPVRSPISTTLTQGVDRIKKRMQRQGYLRAEDHVERAIHDKTKTVDVTIRIDEGPQFSFGKLTIEGLDLNGEAAIRKLWGLQDGKPFDADYPDYFLNRIREDGLFDNLHKTKAVHEGGRTEPPGGRHSAVRVERALSARPRPASSCNWT